MADQKDAHPDETVQVAQKSQDEPTPEQTALKDGFDRMVRFLMTNPDTGEQMSYAESRELYG